MKSSSSTTEAPDALSAARSCAGDGLAGDSERGAILLVVLILGVVGAMAAVTLMTRAEASADSAHDVLLRRRAFYAADGMGRIAIQNIQEYMLEDPDPTTEELRDPERIPVPSIPGFALEEYEVSSEGLAFDAPVTNGAFEGMQALQKPVSIRILAREIATGTAAEVNLMVMLGQISMFQFFAFSTGTLLSYPPPPFSINPGRIHANGDLCMGSYGSYQVEHATTAGRLMTSADSRCYWSVSSGNQASFSNGTGFVTMGLSNSSGCTSCAGTGQEWESYALATWQGHAKDSAHGVPPLRLPISEVALTQAGLNAAREILSNQSSARLVVDPVQAGDSTAILNQRLAWKADLRIINGVWYVNDGSWPGLPIWSDHPGSFTTANEEGLEGEPKSVGQGDLAGARGWSTTPRRYSYYEYDSHLQRLSDDPTGVVSYGTLARTGSGYKPGFWALGAGGSSYTDVDGKAHTSYCEYCSNNSRCSLPLAMRDATTSYCQAPGSGGSYQSALDAQYLQATRGGIIDYRTYNNSSSAGRMLPLNFDVGAFSEAMQDTAPGELGSYFDGGTSFNGIVYITHTWPGAMAGMPDGLATLWPAQGSVLDPAQAVTGSTTRVQRALPFPLCSDSLGYIPNSRRIPFSQPSSDGIDANGFEPWFTIPSCDADVSPLARPNSVRWFNAANVDRTVFPDGLSLVTNLPSYVLGEANTSSDASAETAANWVPLLTAGDAVTLLSNNWRDDNSPWDNSVSLSYRVASSTRYNIALLAGFVEPAPGGYRGDHVETIPRYLEKWTGQLHTLAGSLVVGFNAVYAHQPWGRTNIYDPPGRAWSFDPHLKSLLNHPPGTPLFSIHSFSYLEQNALTP